VEQCAVQALAVYRKGAVSEFFRQQGTPAPALVASVVRQWFFPYLCREDIALLTASLLAAPADGVRRCALATAAVVVRLQPVVESLAREAGNGGGGAEAVFRATCAPAFTRLRLQDPETAALLLDLDSF
jgi:hypothetical protein